ncbi:MAG: 50S ribosomal protein L13 [Candidatus Nanoarchaeia archaeon]|jgi:large subunit ribosomal protein L13|nr:50S ribosomal protein L13 [Candidatus Nanoarchaeia archaeon]MDD3993783.1 50S ribosomal protein L13 [Candidatus Nanoarchaeia archaeon]MDD4563445.1 50S ribosomal protein L13 [Candidatus Nanoarchaeia archaeon]
MVNVIVNAKGAILGRMGSYVAKELLKGNSVEIINSEETIISGKKEYMVEKIKQKRRMGQGSSLKGPKYIRKEDMLLKRIIRGMLPWDRQKGRDAYKRLRCYIGNNNLTEEQIKGIKNFEHHLPLNHYKLKDVVRGLI